MRNFETSLFCTTFFMWTSKLVAGLSTYVCPGDFTENEHKLHYYANLLLCTDVPLNCSGTANEIHESFHDAYQRTVLILHENSNWAKSRRIADSLSKCSIKSVFFNVDESSYYPTSICKASTSSMVVFSMLDYGLLPFIEKNKFISECDHQWTNDTVIERIMHTCLNTIWVIDDDRCDAAYPSSTLQLRLFDKFAVEGNEKVKDKVLKVAALGFVPFIVRKDLGGGNVSWDGIVFQILNRIATNLKFKYEVIEPPDKSYGVLQNNSWNGLIGMLDRKEADIVAAPLTMTYDRNQVIDFSHPYFFEENGILIRLPPKYSTTWKVVYIFNKLLWLFILLSSLFATLQVFLINQYAPPKDNEKVAPSLCVWYVVSTLIGQDMNIKKYETDTMRLFTIIWRLCVFVLSSIYMGGLVVYWPLSYYPLPVKTFADLQDAVVRGEMKVCVLRNTVLHASITVSADLSGFKNFLEANPEFLTDPDTCVTKLSTGYNTAFVTDVTFLKAVQRLLCKDVKTVLLTDRMLPGYLAFGFQKQSSLNAIFSFEMSRIIESGLISVWKVLYADKAVFCEIVEPGQIYNVKAQPLDLIDVGGCFFILAAGCLLSILGFFVEYLIKRNL